MKHKLRLLYKFNNRRQIWRLLPTDTDKLVIEERDINKREAYFNCLDINNGKPFFKHLQFDEKFWIGIEAIYKDIIFFHRYIKPDMPAHKDIIAYSIKEKKIIWENTSCSFLFIFEDKLYGYKTLFEGKEFYLLNYLNGEVAEELGTDAELIKNIRRRYESGKDTDNNIFPDYFGGAAGNERINRLFSDLKEEVPITGNIDFIEFNNLLFFNYHTVNNEGKLKNIFQVIEFQSEKVIFKEVLNAGTAVLIPDSFFIRENSLFLLKEKEQLSVYSII